MIHLRWADGKGARGGSILVTYGATILKPVYVVRLHATGPQFVSDGSLQDVCRLTMVTATTASSAA
mgnify:CR=1 FL=1